MDRKPPPEPCIGRFAFLIHPTCLDDLYACGPGAFARLTAGQQINWQRWITSWSQRHHEPGIAYHLPSMRSHAGGFVEGWLIGIPLTPQQMMRLRVREREVLLDQCLEIARDLEVDMLGLGAFTSIVSRAGSDLVGRGVNITTGNSLTAMAAAESLRMMARRHGRDLARDEVAVVGAAGSVGRLACKRLARSSGRLTLFGNPANPGSLRKLRALAGELCRDALLRIAEGELGGLAATLLPFSHRLVDACRAALAAPGADTHCALLERVQGLAWQARVPAPVAVTTDLAGELPRIPFVVSATSQGSGFIDASMLAPGAIVCDAARPADVVANIRDARPDVCVYEGGLMHLPEAVTFGRRNVVGCEPGTGLACLSETIVLTMSGERRDFSIGAEPPLQDAERVFRLARLHGFEVAIPDTVPAPAAGVRATPLEHAQ